MRAQSLLIPPLKNRTRWQQVPTFWPTPADQSVPDAPRVPQYAFRRGNLWQPQKFWLFPTPADQSIPDRPPLPQYVFRPGGYWQLLNRPIIYPRPVEQSTPDAPVLRTLVFRKGGFWQIQKSLSLDIAPVVIIIPPPPPPPLPILPMGGELGHVVFDSNRVSSDRIRKIYNDLWYRNQDQAKAMLLALLASDAISEEEFIVLFAAMSAQ